MRENSKISKMLISFILCIYWPSYATSSVRCFLLTSVNFKLNGVDNILYIDIGHWTEYRNLESCVGWGGLDSVVDNALGCHHGDPGSNPGQGMWQGSGRPSRFPGFSGFLHHVGSKNANIRTFKNAFLSSMRFLCN